MSESIDFSSTLAKPPRPWPSGGCEIEFPNNLTSSRLTYAREGLEAAGGEDLDGADAAEVPPVVAVRGGGDGGVVVAEVLARDEAGPVGEDDVVLGESFLHGGGGREDDEAAGPEAEGDDAAVLVREAAEGAVERGSQEVEVADDGERGWARWGFFVWFCGLGKELESE